MSAAVGLRIAWTGRRCPHYVPGWSPHTVVICGICGRIFYPTVCDLFHTNHIPGRGDTGAGDDREPRAVIPWGRRTITPDPGAATTERPNAHVEAPSGCSTVAGLPLTCLVSIEAVPTQGSRSHTLRIAVIVGRRTLKQGRRPAGVGGEAGNTPRQARSNSETTKRGGLNAATQVRRHG